MRALLGGGMGLLVLGATARGARAQDLELRGELGAATMLSSYQRNTDPNRYGSSRPGFSYGASASLRGGVSFASLVVLELGVSGWLFASSTQATGTVTGLLAGARFEPSVGRGNRFVVDAHGGVALTGPLTRPTVDASVGLELPVARGFTLGPSLRFGAAFAGGTDASGAPSLYRDAAWFGALGVAGTWRAHEPIPPDADHDGIPDRDDLCPHDPATPPDPRKVGCPLRDADGDGVLDDVDACPTVPAGPHPDPARAGCPRGDADADGVYDDVDRCPSTPAGVHPDPKRPGCPVLDTDGDGVPDDRDRCPDKAGAPHPDPDKNGCPGLVELSAGQLRILQPVFFATNKDTILPQSFPVLQAVADALKAVPEIKRVSIEGHTDDVGDDATNLDLSTRRAQSVMAWLITHGTEPSRLEARGFGETRPLLPNTTEEARAANRRVEFRIVDPTPGKPSSSPGP